jgi:hypothetical protein
VLHDARVEGGIEATSRRKLLEFAVRVEDLDLVLLNWEATVVFGVSPVDDNRAVLFRDGMVTGNGFRRWHRIRDSGEVSRP